MVLHSTVRDSGRDFVAHKYIEELFQESISAPTESQEHFCWSQEHFFGVWGVQGMGEPVKTHILLVKTPI